MGINFLGFTVRLQTMKLGDDWICKYERGSITILHWNIKLTGSYKGGAGKISAADQRVLGMDTRVLWSYQGASKRPREKESNSETKPSKKKKKVAAN